MVQLVMKCSQSKMIQVHAKEIRADLSCATSQAVIYMKQLFPQILQKGYCSEPNISVRFNLALHENADCFFGVFFCLDAH